MTLLLYIYIPLCLYSLTKNILHVGTSCCPLVDYKLVLMNSVTDWDYKTRPQPSSSSARFQQPIIGKYAQAPVNDHILDCVASWSASHRESDRITSHGIASNHHSWHLITSHHIASHHISSYRISSHHILSHLIS